MTMEEWPLLVNRKQLCTLDRVMKTFSESNIKKHMGSNATQQNEVTVLMAQDPASQPSSQTLMSDCVGCRNAPPAPEFSLAAAALPLMSALSQSAPGQEPS